mmetsp:Transcript_44163/g.141562  ORF Transcript_44163/g.141562 Transcript_44163/m.141562 type:complete len:87 (-) Transcript_44163:32-292(-)
MATGLGPTAAWGFAELLRSNCSLEQLWLGWNPAVGDSKGVALAEALQENAATKLLSLDLQYTGMGAATGEAFEALKRTRPQIDVKL